MVIVRFVHYKWSKKEWNTILIFLTEVDRKILFAAIDAIG